jgi:hypothetical protein
MFVWILLMSVGQATGETQSPPVNRRIPPPIPQPPASQPVPQPQPVPVVPQTEVAPPVDATPVPPPPVRTATVRHAFLRQHDINGDGRLSPGELERRFAKQFVMADVNGDGFLDAAEILYDRRAVGKAARRLEGLELDRENRLVFKGDKPPIPIADIARGVIDALDPNRDGFIEGREVGDAVQREVLPRINARIGGGEIAPPPDAPLPSTNTSPMPNALPTRQGDPPSAPMPTQSPVEKSPAPAMQSTGQGGAGATKKDGLPTAEAMIANLDDDGDGQLSESEAVDQLAKNFKTLDRNRDGKLNKEEIDRGLRLARLFGIKPMKPPESYKDTAKKDTPPPK